MIVTLGNSGSRSSSDSVGTDVPIVNRLMRDRKERHRITTPMMLRILKMLSGENNPMFADNAVTITSRGNPMTHEPTKG